jgi:general stress protein YciG
MPRKKRQPAPPKNPKKQAAGRAGGLATARRHGAEHMRTIGRRGWQATVSVVERPGNGAVTYDRLAWLWWRLYGQQQGRQSRNAGE